MGSIPAAGEETFRCPNMLSLESFAGMTLNKCAVFRIGTLTGGPPCRESHPLCRLKNTTVVYMITCRLSSCKTGVYNVCLLIILERGCSSMYRKKEKKDHADNRSHVMRKPVFAICEQQRCRSACASAQSDQHLCCSLPG